MVQKAKSLQQASTSTTIVDKAQMMSEKYDTMCRQAKVRREEKKGGRGGEKGERGREMRKQNNGERGEREGRGREHGNMERKERWR